MKPTHQSSMHKLQKSFPLSSLVWAAIVTAIVLALAASANAQEEAATTNIAPAPNEIRPLPAAAPLKANASLPSPAKRMNMVGVENATGTKPLPPELPAAASSMAAERLQAFEERRSVLMEKLEERREALAEKRALIASSTTARRALLKEEAQKRVIDRAGRLAGVMEGAIDRLTSMSARLRDHADKLAAESVDTTATIAILDEADRLLITAKEALEGVDTNVSYAASSASPQEDWSDAKEQFMEVRSVLEEVRQLLREALTSLKDMSLPPTSTPEAAPTN